MSNGNDILGRSGRPWAKWPAIGDEVRGTVLEEPSVRQSRDYESGDPMTWPNGDPKMEIVVPLKTALRDPEIQGDEGERIVVLPVGSNRFRAVQKAMRDAGVKGLFAGDELAVKYVADGPRDPAKPRLSPPKEFAAEYKKANAAAAKNALDALAGLGAKPIQEEIPF